MFNYQSYSEQQVLDGVKKYGPAQGAKKIIDWEYQHAVDAIQTGIYITWWNEDKKMECGRLGKNSKCYCGHFLGAHQDKYFGKKMNTSCKECECKQFRSIPQRPEECGMYWLPRRKDFNVLKWRPPCKCKHTNEEHGINYPMRCKKCACYGYDSNFACISCDQRWEHHIVLYETEMERRQDKKKIGEEFLPLSTHKEIQEAVFNKEYQLNEEYMWKRPEQKPRITGQQINNFQNLSIQDEECKAVLDGNQQVFPVQQYKTSQQQQYPYQQRQSMQQQKQPSAVGSTVQQQKRYSYNNTNYKPELTNQNVTKKPFLKKNSGNAAKINYPTLQKKKAQQQ